MQIIMIQSFINLVRGDLIIIQKHSAKTYCIQGSYWVPRSLWHSYSHAWCSSYFRCWSRRNGSAWPTWTLSKMEYYYKSVVRHYDVLSLPRVRPLYLGQVAQLPVNRRVHYAWRLFHSFLNYKAFRAFTSLKSRSELNGCPIASRSSYQFTIKALRV